MSQKIKYAILLISYDGDSVIYRELCDTEDEAYKQAHNILFGNDSIADFTVYEVIDKVNFEVIDRIKED